MICKWNAIGYNRYQHQSNAYNAAIPPANIAMLAKHAAIRTIIGQVIQKSSYFSLGRFFWL